MKKITMDEIVNLAKARGFVYAGSEIYGGLANTWDYGPLGIELKNNIQQVWWKTFVQKRSDMVGLDAGILMNPKVWVASGHVGGFSDPLIDCKNCQSRHRADKLIENNATEKGGDIVADGWTPEESLVYLNDNNVVCPTCKERDWGSIREFNLMFKTKQGVLEDTSADIYLRPETAQGIFVNFANVLRTSRKKLPFGVAQVGKAFRNEITPGNFIFRTREFEQMEIEYFVKPEEAKKFHKQWEKDIWKFLKETLQVNRIDDFRLRWHSPEEVSHYSDGTFDIEYQYPFGGWGELWGCASRTDFDLKAHEDNSGKELKYRDPVTNEVYRPYVIEPSFGLSRTVLMILADAYTVEELEGGESRVVMKFAPRLAPIKVAIMPLMKKLGEKAQEIFQELSEYLMCEYDETGSIGKRYRKHDEIGTPYCVTVDFDTTGTGTDSNPELLNTVTVRNRDTMEQSRMPISDLLQFFQEAVR
ncbi:glycine--tRNA ligase [Candidatus Peregrinibacteria bacterium]|nr:MAG: glycine--tRNA ligase [Candidatus Peregrinibacteria bacterium]